MTSRSTVILPLLLPALLVAAACRNGGDSDGDGGMAHDAAQTPDASRNPETGPWPDLGPIPEPYRDPFYCETEADCVCLGMCSCGCYNKYTQEKQTEDGEHCMCDAECFWEDWAVCGCVHNQCQALPVIPRDQPSKQTVTFRLTNETAADVYVAVSGSHCDPWAIQQVPLHWGFACGCECDVDVNLWVDCVTAWETVGPSESYDLVWDARRLATYGEPCCSPEEDSDCDPWSNTAPVPVFQAAGPGHYVFEVGLSKDVDSRVAACENRDEELGCLDACQQCDAECLAEGEWPMDEPLSLCTDMPTVTAEFDLPAEGDLVVDVPLQ